MVLLELYAPFLFGVGMFALLTIVSVALQEALKFITKYNLSANLVLPMLWYASPQFIMLSIPMGTLLGTLLSVGRLNSDLEITGLRALGVSLYRVTLPYLAVGLLLSVLTLYLGERVVPLGNMRLKNLRNNIMLKITGKTEMEPFTLPLYDKASGKLNWFITAGRLEGDTMRDVRLLYIDPRDSLQDFYLQAGTAVWDANQWTFYNLRTVSLAQDPSDPNRVYIGGSQLTLPDFNISPSQMSLRSKTPDDLTYQQLAQVVRERKSKGDAANSVLREFMTKLAFKLSIPFTPLVFVFIAVPLAIRPQRSTSALGMGMALLIVIAYYVLMSVCQKAGTAGALHPVVAAWTPNALMLGTGLWMLRQRERG
jgi:lipopolysaccharide export system permease protein